MPQIVLAAALCTSRRARTRKSRARSGPCRYCRGVAASPRPLSELNMDLANHQRILLGLIRSNYQVRPDDDAYFHSVSQSRDLEEARGNIFPWRVYVLERTCVLTFTLLKQR